MSFSQGQGRPSMGHANGPTLWQAHTYAQLRGLNGALTCPEPPIPW